MINWLAVLYVQNALITLGVIVAFALASDEELESGAPVIVAFWAAVLWPLTVAATVVILLARYLAGKIRAARNSKQSVAS